MKRVFVGSIIAFFMLITFNIGNVSATNMINTTTNITNTTGELKQIKEKSTKELQDYKERYGSDAYGLTAYILDKIRIYSIPICFVGIAIGAIYQYVIGIRKLDVRDRGFGAVIAFVTLLIICQVLPLVFAIVIKGWRG